jgi:hypothetical protein
LLPMNASVRLAASPREPSLRFVTRARLQDRGFRSASRAIRHAFAHPAVGPSLIAVSNGEETIGWNSESGEEISSDVPVEETLRESLRGSTSAESVASADMEHARWIARTENRAARPAVRFQLIERDSAELRWVRHAASDALAEAVGAVISEQGTQMWMIQWIAETPHLIAWDLTRWPDVAGRQLAVLQGLPPWIGLGAGDLRLHQGALADGTGRLAITLTTARSDRLGQHYQPGDSWLVAVPDGEPNLPILQSFVSRQPLLAVAWSADGERLNTVCPLGTIRTWDGSIHKSKLESGPASAHEPSTFEQNIRPLQDGALPSRPASHITIDDTLRNSEDWNRLSQLLERIKLNDSDRSLVAIDDRHHQGAIYHHDKRIVQLYDLSNADAVSAGIPSAELNTPTEVTALEFAPSGSRLLIGFGDGRVAIHRIPLTDIDEKQNRPVTLDELLSFDAHQGSVRSIRLWNEDSMITTGQDGRVLIWTLRR